MKKLLLIYIIASTLIACNKIEGEGGTSTIIGTVTTNNLNGSGELVATYPAADEDVFIIYGNESNTYDDKTSTSFDGSYKFAYLTPGDYTIFIYSDCKTCDSGQEEIKTTITITEKGEVVNAGELINND